MMPNYKKLAKGLNTAIRAAEAEASALQKMKGTQDILPAAEREENLQKFLSHSRIRDRLYHATPKNFSQFKPGGDDPTLSGPAIWLTPDARKQPAAHNIGGGERGFKEGTNVMPVYAQARSPLLLDDKLSIEWAREVFADGSREFPDLISPKTVEELKKSGYDSIIHADPYGNRGGEHEIIMFEPNKIKSAIGNRGTYDVSEPDITKAKGGPIHMQKGGKAGALGKIAEAINAASKEADAIKASKLEEALKAKQAPMTTPQGTGLPLMPRDQGMYTPREQKDLPRMPGVDKARAKGESPKYTERMQDLLDSPTARKKVNTLIEKGEELGMREWYGTEPLRQVAMDIGMSQKQFDEFMAQMASASQRNPVDQQNKMGSFLWHLSQTGQLPDDAFLLTNKIRRGKEAAPKGTAIELPPGYGSLAQGDIFSRGKQIASGDIAGALPPERKLGTFYENLLGNLKPVTVDVNAVRGPIIERGDPRWLASKLVEKDEEGKVIATHFPRKDVQSGLMSMKQAKERPGFWEAAPSGSEYAGFEDLWQRAAKRKGVAPAEAQALGWYGSADVTALKTKPELYIDNLERMIRRTAEQTGQNPRQVMEDVLRGKQYLKKDGGKVEVIRPFSDEKAARKWKDEIATEMNKANGGEIKKLAWRDTKPMRMAQGGQPSLGPVTDNTMPDSSDSGQIKYAPKFAGGGAASPEEAMTLPTEGEKGKARLMMEILARMAKDQGKEEIASLKKPRAATDVLNKGLIASTVGAPVDIMNMGLEGVDALRGLASGKPVENRLASDQPFLGSDHLKSLMQKYGMVTDEERPMLETATSILSPGAAVKGVAQAPKAARSAMSGLGGMKRRVPVLAGSN